MTFLLAILSLLVLLHSYHFRHHNSRHSHSPLNLWHLSAIVLGFWTCSTVIEESHTTKTTTLIVFTMYLAPINFLQVPLWSSHPDLLSHGNFTVIKARTCHHAPPKEATPQSRASCANLWSLLTSSLPRHP